MWMAIVEDQLVEVKWHYSNREWYEEKGYVFTKNKDTFYVKVDELMDSSKANVKVICDMCGEEGVKKYTFIRFKENHFCDRDCYKEFRRKYGSHNNTSVTINCSFCHKEYKIKLSRYEKFKNGETKSLCCSRKCQNKLSGMSKRGENHPGYKDRITLNCDYCDKGFMIKPHRLGRAKYCSVSCQRKGVGLQNTPTKLRIINCTTCDKKFSAWEHNIVKYETHYCSRECKDKNQGYFLSKTKRNTECQLRLNDLLEEISIKFTNEKPIDYYSVDNYLPEHDLIIEVMGDYWHSNPIVYPSYSHLNEMQTKRVRIDKSKKTHIFNKTSIKMLYLWESCILERPELCIKLIYKYVKNQGILKDYNSFNFNLVDDELVFDFKDSPYFLKKNTNKQII